MTTPTRRPDEGHDEGIERETIHVMPYDDGSRYKNGKLKTKWIVKTGTELKGKVTKDEK